MEEEHDVGGRTSAQNRMTKWANTILRETNFSYLSFLVNYMPFTLM